MNAIKLLLSPYPFVLFIISKMFSIKKYLKKNPRSIYSREGTVKYSLFKIHYEFIVYYY